MKLSAIATVFGAALLFGTPAKAMFIDFTDGAWSNLFAGGDSPIPPTSTMTVFNAGGAGFDVTATVTNGAPQPVESFFLDTTESINTASNVCIGGVDGGPVFACSHDGLGAGVDNADPDRDEIDGNEVLTITISQVVEITAIYLLDFFFSGENQEIANVDYSNGNSDTFQPSVVADDPGTGTGYAAFAVANERTTTLVFRAGTLDGQNDDAGVGDFALAGIEFNVVEDREIPVPAALPLLLTGLFGLGMLGRRRRTEA